MFRIYKTNCQIPNRVSVSLRQRELNLQACLYILSSGNTVQQKHSILSTNHTTHELIQASDSLHGQIMVRGKSLNHTEEKGALRGSYRHLQISFQGSREPAQDSRLKIMNQKN